MPKISGLPQDSAPTVTDYIVVNDTETGQTKRVLLSDLATLLFASYVTKSVDANGWTVYDYKTFKMYRYDVGVNNLVTSGNRVKVGTLALPAGVSAGSVKALISWEGSFGGHAVLGLEPATSSGWDLYVANQYGGGSLTFTGTARVLAITA